MWQLHLVHAAGGQKYHPSPPIVTHPGELGLVSQVENFGFDIAGPVTMNQRGISPVLHVRCLGPVPTITLGSLTRSQNRLETLGEN